MVSSMFSLISFTPRLSRILQEIRRTNLRHPLILLQLLGLPLLLPLLLLFLLLVSSQFLLLFLLLVPLFPVPRPPLRTLHRLWLFRIRLRLFYLSLPSTLILSLVLGLLLVRLRRLHLGPLVTLLPQQGLPRRRGRKKSLLPGTSPLFVAHSMTDVRLLQEIMLGSLERRKPRAR
jgi:hypothetical protein